MEKEQDKIQVNLIKEPSNPDVEFERVALAKGFIRKPDAYRLALELKMAMMCGPMSGLNERMDVIFERHFGLKWSQVHI